MGSKTVRFDEFDQRVQQYWLPTDFDFAAVSREVSDIAAGWQQGYVRLVFDDATQVLTQIDHRLDSGAYQEVWATGMTPAAVIGAYREANMPQSFTEMWQTYKGWDDFVAWCAETQRSENVNFLLAVEAYRQAPGVPAQLALYSRFIAPGAAEPVNLDDHEMVSRIEENATGAAEVFDEAQQEIMRMLAGSFGTFQTWYRNRPAG